MCTKTTADQCDFPLYSGKSQQKAEAQQEAAANAISPARERASSFLVKKKKLIVLK